jgi:multidrug efflux pump
MALVIATGFVVDDAIVMIENIARHRDMGKNALQAALDGSAEIGFTIMSLTLSLVAVLIPLLFMQDMLGRLFNEFAITLACAILLSAIVSLTLTPMLSARLMHEIPPSTSLIKGGTTASTPSLIKRVAKGEEILITYQRALRWVLAHQKTTLAATLMIFIATVSLYVSIPKGFFPTQDTGSMMAIVDVPESTSFDAFVERQQSLSHHLLQNPSIDNITAFIGVDGNNATPNSGRLLIQLKPKDERNDSSEKIIQQLMMASEQHPDIRLHLQAVQDLTVEDQVTRGQYQFKLSSPDSEALAQATQQLVEQLQHLPMLQDVSADTQPSGLQAFINIDRDAAARLGVSTKSIDQALYNAFGQRLISTIFTQSNQYRVVLETSANQQAAINQLGRVYVSNNQGKPIPLDSLASISERQAPLAITRLDQFPSTTLSFNLAPRASLGDAIEAITQEQAKLDLPAGIETHWQGATQAFRTSLSNTLFLLLAAVVTVYILLGVLYESFIHPITILSTLFPAAIGAFLALDFAGLSLDMIGVIGLILLIGIVKKNAIMMINFALDAMRTQGLAAQEAIFQACSLRLRPILMTTFAALFGALPLMLSTGLGAELRQPMGYALVGGLLLSQLLTLFTTPVIFLFFERLAGSKSGL